MRKLQRNEPVASWCKRHGVTLSLSCDYESDAIEGNASAIDPETDAAAVALIRSQLRAGNEWAWCCAIVTATHDASGLQGKDTLGHCSYASRDEFERSDYFESMQREAIADLCQTVDTMRRAVCAGHNVKG